MEYKRLVQKIVEAEHSAQEMARQAQERAGHLEEDLERERTAMRDSYLERARRRVEQVREEEQRQTRLQLEALDKHLQASLAQADAALAQNRDRWVELLFHRIVDDRE